MSLITIPNLYELEEKDGNIIIKPYDYSKLTICGRKLEQVMQILNGLDLEKEKGMLLTMEHLGEWCELVKKDIHENMQIQIQKAADNLVEKVDDE